MNSSILPIQPTNLPLFEQRYRHIQNTINNGTHHQLIQDVTMAIDDVFQSQLLVLLDIRAYAHAMEGHYQLACTDAEQMIEYAPHLPAGYVRQGIVFSMYGRQTKAIEKFDYALLIANNSSNNNNNNTSTQHAQQQQQEDIKRLIACKNEAISLNDRRVDFIARLPVEIVNSIITLLPKSSKVSCMRVARIWAQRTLDCASAWKTLSASGNRIDNQVAAKTECIAGHIEKLRIDTPNKIVRSKYIQCMRNGLFKRLRSLTMTGSNRNDIDYTQYKLYLLTWWY